LEIGAIRKADPEYVCLTDSGPRQCTSRMIYGKFHSNHCF